MADDLPTLSTVGNALNAMIYPFFWQHIFIPVLPNELIGYTMAPMPFILGILRSYVNEISREYTGDVVIIDVNDGKYLNYPKISSFNSLPDSVASKTRRSLRAMRSFVERSPKFDLSVATIFTHFFAEIFVGYQHCYKEDNEFDFDKFISEKRSRDLKKFLEGFQGSQMFNVFITLNGKKKLEERFKFSTKIIKSMRTFFHFQNFFLIFQL